MIVKVLYFVISLLYQIIFYNYIEKDKLIVKSDSTYSHSYLFLSVKKVPQFYLAEGVGFEPT